MKVNQTVYENLKREVQGFYWKFNESVLKWHITKIFTYETLLESAKDFNNFTDFYDFHVKNKSFLIESHIVKMVEESNNKGLLTNSHQVRACLVVRMGNIYNGMWIENKILNTFNNLAPYITCIKTEKEVDILYKVDGIVELAGLDRLSIQIKPVSFKNYDNGSELQFHKRFTEEFGPQVFYVFYKDKNTIIFNNVEIKLTDNFKIIKQIENILVNSFA